MCKEIHMFRITEICLSGFRNVVNTKIRTGDIACLVSSNNYGKTNVIDGILFGIKLFKATQSDREAQMGLSLDTPALQTNPSKSFDFKLTLKDENGEEIIYGYSFAWGTTDKPGFIQNEYLKIVKKGSKRPTTLIIRDKPEVFRYKSTDSSTKMDKISIEPSNLAISVLSVLNDVFFMDKIKTVISCHFINDYFFDISQGDVALYLSGAKNVRFGFTPLPSAFAYLKRDNPNDARALVDAMKSLFPDVENIISIDGPTDPKDGRSVIDNKYNNPWALHISAILVKSKTLSNPIDFHRMSVGFRRIFVFLFHILQLQNEEEPTILAIEEPENSIQPSLLKMFLDIVKGFNSQLSIIFDSHSPFILSYLSPSSLYLGLPSEDGSACFRPFKASKIGPLENDAYESDLLIGQYITDLLGGDKEDIEKLNRYLEGSKCRKDA